MLENVSKSNLIKGLNFMQEIPPSPETENKLKEFLSEQEFDILKAVLFGAIKLHNDPVELEKLKLSNKSLYDITKFLIEHIDLNKSIMRKGDKTNGLHLAVNIQEPEVRNENSIDKEKIISTFKELEKVVNDENKSRSLITSLNYKERVILESITTLVSKTGLVGTLVMEGLTGLTFNSPFELTQYFLKNLSKDDLVKIQQMADINDTMNTTTLKGIE